MRAHNLCRLRDMVEAYFDADGARPAFQP